MNHKRSFLIVNGGTERMIRVSFVIGIGVFFCSGAQNSHNLILKKEMLTRYIKEK
jgi:hypothetical protein